MFFFSPGLTITFEISALKKTAVHNFQWKIQGAINFPLVNFLKN